MELQGYLNILTRRWRIILLVLFVTSSVFAYGGRFVPPSYQAETRLRVVTPLGGVLGETYHEINFASRQINTYAQIATSEQVMIELKEKMNLETLPEISVKIIPDSEIIQIIVVSSDPEITAKTANYLAEVIINKVMEGAANSENSNMLIDRLNELEENLTQTTQEYNKLVQTYSQATAQIALLDQKIRLKEASYQFFLSQQQLQNMRIVENDLEVLGQQYEKLSVSSYTYLQQVTTARQKIENDQRIYSDLLYQYDHAIDAGDGNILIISPAVEPSIPSGPGYWFVVGLGGLCGVIGGVILAFVIDKLDTRIFTSEQISQITTIPVLGHLPKIQNIKNHNVFLNGGARVFHKDYWIISTKLLGILQSGLARTILLTSPSRMEGKSIYVSNIAQSLAQSLAQRNNRVLIVDADLCASQQQKIYQISIKHDLSSFLGNEGCEVEDVVQKNVGPDVDLIPSLTICDDSTEMLKSPRLATLLEKIKGYEIVFFDSPALMTTPSFYSLAKNVDGVIVIAQCGSTTYEDIQYTCNYLEGIKSKFLGIVLVRCK